MAGDSGSSLNEGPAVGTSVVTGADWGGVDLVMANYTGLRFFRRSLGGMGGVGIAGLAPDVSIAVGKCGFVIVLRWAAIDPYAQFETMYSKALNRGA